VKALYKPASAPGFELTDRPEPEPAPHEVKIRVLRTGICGTDLHIEAWDAWAAASVDAPLIAGHEFCGEVVEVGREVRDVAVGDIVSGEGHVVCGTCRNCRAGRRHLCIRTSSVGVNRDGAFAEYVVLPEPNVWVHRDGIDPDLGAIFDPFGNAVHTALSFPLVGEDVLITGAGPIGVGAVPMALKAGARYVVVTDVNEYRLALAKKMGATAVVNVAKEDLRATMKSLGMSEGFDVGLEMSGNPAGLRQMIDTMAHGGKIAMLGIQSGETGVDWDAVVFKGLNLRGIYGRMFGENWYKLTSMIQSGMDISPVITHRYSYKDFQQGFDVMRSGNSGKVILDWSEL
jgi:threonine 3-dehydrogenase